MKTLLAVLAFALAADAPEARADLGVQMDVGVPGGAQGALVYRPVRALRVHAGGAHNGIGPGLRGGASVIPFGTVVTPTLVIDAGRFFARDANPVIEDVSGEPSDLGTFERFGYDFASAHVGLEVGRSRATFYLRGGVSWVRAELGGDDMADDGSSSTTTDVEVRAIGASASLGFIIYFAK